MEIMIYAIISAKKNCDEVQTRLLPIRGISDSKIYDIPFGEISAIAGPVNKSGIVSDRNKAIEYASVIDNLWKHFALLPMRYGSFMETDADIQKMLGRNYEGFQQNLGKVENMSEFGLKVFCDYDIIKAELKAIAQSETKTTSQLVSGVENSVFKDYVNKKLAEHRVEESMFKYIDSVIVAIKISLTGLFTDSKFKKMAGTTNIIDAVFLLQKHNEGELIQQVETMQKQYPGLNFLLTGPWPPYSFVEITIK